MADTHINAYFADVAEHEQKVLEAHAEWEAAKARLETKKKEVGYVEDPTPKAEKPTETPKKK